MVHDIEELRSQLKHHQEAYYNLTPEITDSEYDALVELVKSIDPNIPELKSVGAPPQSHSVWNKIKHIIPMGSLDKVNTEQEFNIWVEKVNTEDLFITHKIDGSSMELIYEKGILKRCVSRGDGIIGDDVYYNISKIPNIPHQLPYQHDIIVRGEVVMLKDVFEKLYSNEYANPRNTAAGKVREKKNNGNDCINLIFLAYKLHYDQSQSRTMTDMFNELEQLGFQVPSRKCGSIETMKSVFNTINKERNSIQYEIDGLVISVNNLQNLGELGDLNMRPRGQIAWKFESAKGITTVEDVRWQVGLTGIVCPVCDITPIKIGGVTITHVTLHNLTFFNNLKLFKGCKVLVSRRNDVTPYIEANLDSQTNAYDSTTEKI